MRSDGRCKIIESLGCQEGSVDGRSGWLHLVALGGFEDPAGDRPARSRVSAKMASLSGLRVVDEAGPTGGSREFQRTLYSDISFLGLPVPFTAA